MSEQESKPVAVPGSFEMSPTIAAFAAAFATAQGQIEDAAARAENDFFKSRYADLSMVREVIRKPFADNGLSYVQLPTTEHGRVVVTTMLMHSSGEWIRSSVAINCRSTAHEIGSAITYARRYGLSAMAGVCVEQDDDGNAAASGMAAEQNGNGQKTQPPKASATPAAKKPDGPSPAQLSAQEFEAARQGIVQARTLAELGAVGNLIRTSKHLSKDQRERLVKLGVEAKADLEKLAAEQAEADAAHA